jgi:hypothetical protein
MLEFAYAGHAGSQLTFRISAFGALITSRAPTLWRGHAMALGDRANNILPLLLSEERLKSSEIAFVAHSFGGLIVEQTLHDT